MNTKTDRAEQYAAVVARNHARLAAMADRRTAALGLAEDLTLAGEVLEQPRPMDRAAVLQREEPEQGTLF